MRDITGNMLFGTCWARRRPHCGDRRSHALLFALSAALCLALTSCTDSSAEDPSHSPGPVAQSTATGYADARVDMFIGGEYKGTFYYGGTYPWEYTINNVAHKAGNQEVKLVVRHDDGSRNLNVDYLKIG